MPTHFVMYITPLSEIAHFLNATCNYACPFSLDKLHFSLFVIFRGKYNTTTPLYTSLTMFQILKNSNCKDKAPSHIYMVKTILKEQLDAVHKNVHCNYIEDGVAGLTGLINNFTLIKAELHITFNLECFMNCSLIQKGLAEIGDFFLNERRTFQYMET